MTEVEHTVSRPQLVAREQRKRPAVAAEAEPGTHQAHLRALAGALAEGLDTMDDDTEREYKLALQRAKDRRPGQCGKCRTPGTQELPVPSSRCRHAALCQTCHGQLQVACEEDAEFAEEIRVAVCFDCCAEVAAADGVEVAAADRAEVATAADGAEVAAAADDADDATQPMGVP